MWPAAWPCSAAQGVWCGRLRSMLTWAESPSLFVRSRPQYPKCGRQHCVSVIGGRVPTRAAAGTREALRAGRREFRERERVVGRCSGRVGSARWSVFGWGGRSVRAHLHQDGVVLRRADQSANDAALQWIGQHRCHSVHPRPRITQIVVGIGEGDVATGSCLAR